SSDLAVIVVVVAASFRNELTKDELIGALPVLPPASPTELQPASPLAALTETAKENSGAPRELVPSPRPRPMHKPRPRQAHNMRNRSNSGVPKLLPAGAPEIQPLGPLATSTAAAPADDAETAMQSSVKVIRHCAFGHLDFGAVQIRRDGHAKP